MKKLADFLEVSCDEKMANEIADKCSFDKLKEANLSKNGQKDQRKFRKGDGRDLLIILILNVV